MIVCLCTGANDRDIREAISDGAKTQKQVERACGAGGECGSCHEMVKDMLCDSRCSTPARAPLRTPSSLPVLAAMRSAGGGPSALALMRENEDQ